MGLLADKDLAGPVSRLQRGGCLDGVARDQRLAGAPVASQHLAGVDPDRNCLATASEGVAQLDSCSDGAQRVVLVSDRHPEDAHHAAILQPLDRGAVPLEHRCDHLEQPLADLPSQLRIASSRRRLAGATADENRDRLAAQAGGSRRLGLDGLRRFARLAVTPSGSSRVLLRQVELGVLAQDGLVQLAQVAARLDAELLDEPAPGRLVDIQRVGLAATAVEGEHELAAQALLQRVLGREGFQLADQLGVLAEREIGLDRALPDSRGGPPPGGRSRPGRRARSGSRPAAGPATSPAPRAVGGRRRTSRRLPVAGCPRHGRARIVSHRAARARSRVRSRAPACV